MILGSLNYSDGKPFRLECYMLVSGFDLLRIRILPLMDLQTISRIRLLPILERIYERTLRYSLKGRNTYAFFGGSIFMLFFAFCPDGSYRSLRWNSSRSMSRTISTYFIQTPIGTDIEVTNKVTSEEIEDYIS